MSETVAILGRQPALGLAELESLLGADVVHPFGKGAAWLKVAPDDFPMNRLGGTLKAATLLVTLPFNDWEQIEKFLVMALPKQLPNIPEGKIRLGLSTYGLTVGVKRQNATGLELKKAIKTAGRSVRVVPNIQSELNSAQVLHNQLTGPTGLELLLIAHGSQVVLAQTFAVQDIEAYAARDQARPKRDARVGMLPPKLAQIIINLAGTHQLPKGAQPDEDTLVSRHQATLLDPFCGTGVILQEALLMGYNVMGTDLEPRMIDYAKANLTWLTEKRPVTGSRNLTVADATDTTWAQPFDLLAAETYLGRPFSAPPPPETLAGVMRDVDTIHKKFLQNVVRQTKAGFRLAIAVPAWKTDRGFKHLKVLDSLEELGYTRISFAHVRNEDLMYHRPDQVVARELVVLRRK